jgi:hypothetical protein
MNNPPAFPLHNHGVQTLGLHITGMSLRDYMAAKAMQGLLAGNLSTLQGLDKSFQSDGSISDIAYKMADTMLIAREK